MSDIEPKEEFKKIAIDLINEYRQQRCLMPADFFPIQTPENSAFIRANQLHEKTKKELADCEKELADCKQELSDFKQEVSDVVWGYFMPHDIPLVFQQFIIPAPKPDPLLAALLELELSSDLQEGQHDAKWIRDKLDELGFEIREKG